MRCPGTDARTPGMDVHFQGCHMALPQNPSVLLVAPFALTGEVVVS